MELMRGLAFIALLFAGSAVGAELRQAEVCGDGTTHQAGYCPAVLSSASCSATGATTGSCSATSDETDGTRYVCATSNTTALTGAEIEACSGGAAINGSSAAETGSNSVSLSGLTTDAAHYGQIVNESPEGWYSNRLVSSSFTPNSNNAMYDLGTLPTVTIADRNGDTGGFEELQWPNPPVTTQTINVTNTSELITAAATPGALINIAAGTYTTDLTIREADQDFVWDNAAILNGDITIRNDLGQIRTRWTGGVINGRIWSDGHTDLLFNNIRQEELDEGNSFGRVFPSYRLAIINSTMDCNRNCIFATSSQPIYDTIIANNDLHGGKFTGTGAHEPAVRIMFAKRAVIVDNKIKTGDGRETLFKHTFRFHEDSDLVYFARNLTLETGWMADNINDPECDRVWLIDNDIYHRLNSLVQLNASCRAVTASGNEAWSYYNSGPGDTTIQALQGWPVGVLWNITGGGGVAHPYDADAQAAAEAAWTGGADH